MTAFRSTIRLAVLLFVSASLRAQSVNVDSALVAIQTMYYAGSYVGAEVEGRRLLESSAISDSSRLFAEQWISFSLVAQGKHELAREHFRALLRIDPTHELDPVLTSPKILIVFNGTKAAVQADRRPARDPAGDGQVPQRRTVSIRTILFPGWEQLARGRSVSGTAFLAAGTLTLGTGIVLELLRSSARRDYLAATSPDQIASRYDRYNRYRTFEITSFALFGLVYLASELDVFLGDAPVSLAVRSITSPELSSQIVIALRLP